MTPEQEKRLCRLLKLKRYEQPPPGYFDGFSRQVIARIKAGEVAERAPLMEKLAREASWLRRVFALLEEKPALAGVFGALVCAALISGVVFSERMESTSLSGAVPAPEIAEARVGALPPLPLVQPALQPALVSSTNPVMPSGSSLFDLTRPLEVQPVSGQDRN